MEARPGIQQLPPPPATIDRVETGAVRFGNDWPGLFIRGDDCMSLLMALETMDGVFRRSVLASEEVLLLDALTTLKETIEAHVII